MTIATSRPDADQSLIPRRGSLDVTRLLQRRTLYRYPTRGDLIHASRARDVRLVFVAVVVGVVIGVVLTIGAASWRVVANGGLPL